MNISRRGAVTALPQPGRCLLLFTALLYATDSSTVTVFYAGDRSKSLLSVGRMYVLFPVPHSVGGSVIPYEGIVWFA